MKQCGKSFVAIILSLCILITASTTAFAADSGETSVQIPADGVNDSWVQDTATIKLSGTVNDAVNEVTAAGQLHLKAGSKNGNNPSIASPPAIFVDETASEALASQTEQKTMSMTLSSVTSLADTRFGIYLNYLDQFHGLYLGYDAGGWFWQKYDGSTNPYQSTGVAGPEGSTPVDLVIKWTGTKIDSVTANGTTIDGFTDLDFSTIPGGNKVAVKLGTYGTAITEMNLTNIHYSNQRLITAYDVSGKVKDSGDNALADASIYVNGAVKTISGADGTYTVAGLASGDYTLTVKKEGYNDATSDVTVGNASIQSNDIIMEAVAGLETGVISSDDMDVLVDQNFPRILQYTMKKLDNKVLYGQSDILNTITINGTDVQVADVTSIMDDGKVTYTIPVKDSDHNIDAVLTAEFVVDKNTLAFNIIKVQNNLADNDYPVQSIDIPNQSLISVRSTQIGANFKGAVMSVDTAVSGDRGFNVENATLGKSTYMYGFVSNSDLSAGIWSNSEIGSSAGGSDNNRITAVTVNKGAYITTGLKSSMWYYHRKVTTKVNDTNVDYVVDSVEMPSTKVVITGDENSDTQIDWQDGAIAFRSIMNNPEKSDEVPDLVAYRIAMNFGSQAQNPFLTTLDNVKKVALNTDGLGQSVLLKGYANEGHDSGHPDYGDIGQRIGGAADMNTLMVDGATYGARFGIHVNASEMYPEAKAFSEELVRWDSTNLMHYGWNWLDQGVGINALFDLGSGQRANRFQKLYDEVGNNLDFVYVDVWGNGTSGSEDAWQTRQLSNEITSHGWRMADEWGYANEYDATFQHWATDLTYGGSTLKGINSEVMRFLRNDQKDSWVADYPSYGAAAQAPLLGGYSMKDFEGWQGRSDYDAYIKNLFAYDLSTKFIQHYKVTKWVDGDPVKMTSTSKSYVPDKQITLNDADTNNAVQITRKSTDPTNMNDYRTRTMTLNGTTILQGRANGGDYTNYQDGDETYLIPWYWAADGSLLAEKDQKLYHWNTKGGTTTWGLPTGWENVSNVKVYQLTDEGKTNEQTVQVQDGQITLTATAQTPYVVTKGDEASLTVEWSTGMHITDAGFNSGKLDNWTVTGAANASVVKNMSANEMLKLSGESSLTQSLTDLKPGTEYAAYVGVDNRSAVNASMTIKDVSGNVLASNYGGKSISDALNVAKAVLDKEGAATAEEISKAFTDLQNGIDNLKQIVNTEPLQTLYDAHKADQGKTNPQYTTDTWNAFQQALAAAKAILGNADANQGEVTYAYNVLLSAFNSLQKTTAIDVNDAVTGVQVQVPVGGLPEGTKITVTPITVGTQYTMVKTALSQVEKFSLFNISASMDDVLVEPADGGVNISIPIPADYDPARVVVYYIDDEGKRQLMVGALDGTRTHYTFFTPHLSLYALAQIKSGSSSGGSTGGTIITTPTNSLPGCTSDTTNNLTVNGTYQFKITSTNGVAPTFVVGTPGVFKVELVRHNGNDYFYKVTAIGSTGQQAGVYVNGGSKLLVLTVMHNAKTTPNCTSDTTNDLTVHDAYQFKITSTNGVAPTFVIGTPGVFKVELTSHNGNDYFYKVTAIGNANRKAGVYVNGGSKLLVLTVG